MAKEYETYADLIDFLERFLRGPMTDEWEIDDFCSTPMPKKSGLEPWRKIVLDIIAAQRAPKGQLVHRDGLAELQRVIDLLLYMEKHEGENYRTPRS